MTTAPTTSRLPPFTPRVLAVCVLLLLVGLGLVFPFPFHGRLWGEVFDLAHAPVFFLALIGVVGFFDPSAVGLGDRWSAIVPMTAFRIGAVTLFLTGVGLAGEFLQGLSGRSASWHDVRANSLGLLAGILWVAAHRFVHWRRWLIGTAISVLIIVSISPGVNAYHCWQYQRQFPLIASFETDTELQLWRCREAELTRIHNGATQGNYAGRIHFFHGRYPGISLQWLPGDWSPFQFLKFDFQHPGSQSLQLILKVTDRQHAYNGFPHDDRFHREITIRPASGGTVTISVAEIRDAPATRQMNLQEMGVLELFCVDRTTEDLLLIDNIRLE